MLSKSSRCLRALQHSRALPAPLQQVVKTPVVGLTVTPQPITCVVDSAVEAIKLKEVLCPRKWQESSCAAVERSLKLVSVNDDRRDTSDTLQQQKATVSKTRRVTTYIKAQPRLNQLFVGCAEDKGQKKYMEDRHSICTFSSSSGPSQDWAGGVWLDPAAAYAAVFDGHGGHQTAAHAARQLHQDIWKRLHKTQTADHSRSNSSGGGIRPRSQSPVHRHRPGSVAEAIKDTFIQFDEAWRDATSGMSFDNSGSTAVVAMVNQGNIIIANAGDSVALLARAGSAVRLSKLHKAEDDDEAVRVMAAGGVLSKGKQGLRVMQNPATLPAGERYAKQPHVANTRSFGDFKLKRHNHPIVSAEPSVVERKLTLQDTLVLLASDGITDVMHDQEIVDVATEAVQQARSSAGCKQELADAAAAAVKSAAMRQGAWDNLTAVVMLLDWGYQGWGKGELWGSLRSTDSGRHYLPGNQQALKHLVKTAFIDEPCGESIGKHALRQGHRV